MCLGLVCLVFAIALEKDATATGRRLGSTVLKVRFC